MIAKSRMKITEKAIENSMKSICGNTQIHHALQFEFRLVYFVR